VPVAQQRRLRCVPRLGELGLQQLRHCRAEDVLMPGMLVGQRADFASNPGGIEIVSFDRVWCRCGIHCLSG
jgi:hypothetical protein